VEPLKVELDAFWEVMLTPVAEFITEKERAERTEAKAEKLAHDRMAKTAIKAVDKARGERTLWMVVLRFGRENRTFYSSFGPYPTKGQAEKAVTQLGETYGYTAYAVVPMRNAEGLAEMLANLDNGAESKGDYGIVLEDAKLFKAGWTGKNAERAKFLERVM
jgi:hypothetical protein